MGIFSCEFKSHLGHSIMRMQRNANNHQLVVSILFLSIFLQLWKIRIILKKLNDFLGCNGVPTGSDARVAFGAESDYGNRYGSCDYSITNLKDE